MWFSAPLLIVGPILVGLFIFKEWKTITNPQYVGMALILTGIVLCAFFGGEVTQTGRDGVGADQLPPAHRVGGNATGYL